MFCKNSTVYLCKKIIYHAGMIFIVSLYNVIITEACVGGHGYSSLSVCLFV